MPFGFNDACHRAMPAQKQWKTVVNHIACVMLSIYPWHIVLGVLLRDLWGKVKRETGGFVACCDGHSGAAPRCCRPDESGRMPLCRASHGKAPEENDGEPEDRPGTNVVPILGVRGEVLTIRCPVFATPSQSRSDAVSSIPQPIFRSALPRFDFHAGSRRAVFVRAIRVCSHSNRCVFAVKAKR